MLSLGLHLNLSLAQEPALASMLKKSERWLRDDSHRMHALERLQDPYRADLYIDLVDYLFCEIFTWHQEDCFAFYDDKGPPMRKLMSKDEIDLYDRFMLNCLKAAYEIYLSDLQFSWVEYREQMLAVLE